LESDGFSDTLDDNIWKVVPEMAFDFRHMLHDDLLDVAAARYGLDRQSLRDIAGNVNIVFEAVRESQAVILRLTPVSRRTYAEVAAEADFVQALGQGGASVCRVLPSADGNTAEAVGDDFTAVLFEKAAGRPVQEEDWTPALYERWGELTGRLHRLAQTHARHLEPTRRAWHEEDLVRLADIPAEQTLVHQHAQDVIAELHRLPTDPDAYGLVHGDLHAGNLFLHDGTFIAYDFDDSCRSWFAYDIALVLYHALARLSKPPRATNAGEAELAAEFLTHFRRGYERENQLDLTWWRRLPLFLKLRRIQLYIVYHQMCDFSNLREEMAQRIAQFRHDIEADFPITNALFAFEA
jgi:amicoumacin kinase